MPCSRSKPKRVCGGDWAPHSVESRRRAFRRARRLRLGHLACGALALSRSMISSGGASSAGVTIAGSARAPGWPGSSPGIRPLSADDCNSMQLHNRRGRTQFENQAPQHAPSGLRWVRSVIASRRVSWAQAWRGDSRHRDQPRVDPIGRLQRPAPGQSEADWRGRRRSCARAPARATDLRQRTVTVSRRSRAPQEPEPSRPDNHGMAAIRQVPLDVAEFPGAQVAPLTACAGRPVPSPLSTQSGRRGRIHSHSRLPIDLPMSCFAIPGSSSHLILAAVPYFTEFFSGLGQPPSHGRFSSAHDRRHFRRRKTFQISQHQDRPVRDRHQRENELDLLRQLGLNPGIGVRELKFGFSITTGSIDRGRRGGRSCCCEASLNPD